MSKQTLGMALMIGGLAMAFAGAVGWATSGEGDSPVAGASTTTTSTSTADRPDATTTSLNTNPTESEPERQPATTSTTVAPTTTTIDAIAEIEAFVVDFAAAIEREDEDFLFDRLHSAVLTLFNETECRTFIEEQILQLENYRQTGDVTGPAPQTIADVVVDMYTTPVAFGFQGQDVTSDAAYAFEDSEVRWFTQCGV